MEELYASRLHPVRQHFNAGCERLSVTAVSWRRDKARYDVRLICDSWRYIPITLIDRWRDNECYRLIAATIKFWDKMPVGPVSLRSMR
jgi:hypothetical protein